MFVGRDTTRHRTWVRDGRRPTLPINLEPFVMRRLTSAFKSLTTATSSTLLSEHELVAEWDRQRNAARSGRDRAEIDALFGRSL
jgi:hypothetical protein